MSDYIKEQFGKYNYWGGDGTNTFAVPDLRGEFLRGTGTASRNTGSGGNVGTHQDATSEIMHQSSEGLGSPRITLSGYANNYDKMLSNNLKSVKWGASRLGVDNTGYSYTARPTNTSVLYCIKY